MAIAADPYAEMVAVQARLAALVPAAMPLDGDGWDTHTDAIEAAYLAHDLAAFRAAVRAYEVWAANEVAAWGRLCRHCGRNAGTHKRADVCARYTPNVDVLEAVAA